MNKRTVAFLLAVPLLTVLLGGGTLAECGPFQCNTTTFVTSAQGACSSQRGSFATKLGRIVRLAQYLSYRIFRGCRCPAFVVGPSRRLDCKGTGKRNKSKQVILILGVSFVYAYIVAIGLSFVGTLYFGPVLFQAVFAAVVCGLGAIASLGVQNVRYRE
ncbi:hypothetical protein BJV82DRAFT_14624 [Fennellomyces sp. T-0311]|nr:hypothetical protein BJV82DRAFT_14624 [Fennellomyces sp. T-0311]